MLGFRVSSGSYARRMVILAGLILASVPLRGQGVDAEMMLRVGFGTLNQGRYQESEMAFRKLLDAVPCHGRAIAGLAEIRFRQRKPEEALTLARTEVEKCSASADALITLGDLELRTEKLDEAAAAYQRAKEVAAKQPSVAGIISFRMGEVHRRRGDKEAWGKALDEAEQTLKETASFHVSKALYQDATGQKQAAMISYRQALQIQPNDGIALNNLAFLMVETGGDLDSAMEMAKRASALLPDSAEVADTLGWIYTRKRWADVAVMLLKTSLQRAPENEMTRKHMLEALELKDQGQLGQELKAALKEPPGPENSERIKTLLFKIK